MFLISCPNNFNHIIWHQEQLIVLFLFLCSWTFTSSPLFFPPLFCMQIASHNSFCHHRNLTHWWLIWSAFQLFFILGNLKFNGKKNKKNSSLINEWNKIPYVFVPHNEGKHSVHFCVHYQLQMFLILLHNLQSTHIFSTFFFI